MRITWAFLCRSSAIDIDTNSISLFNIIEDISVPSDPPVVDEEEEDSFPMALGSCELIVASARTDLSVPERSPVRVLLEFPTETPPAVLLEAEINLESAQRNRFRLQLPGLPISGRGTYRFVIEVQQPDGEEWHQLHEVPISVEYQTQDYS